MGDNNSRFSPEQVALLRRIAEKHRELVDLVSEVERIVGYQINATCGIYEAKDRDMAIEMLQIMGFPQNAIRFHRFNEPKYHTTIEPYGWGIAYVEYGDSLKSFSIKFPLREGE